jgi:hypothetical protein
VGTKLGLDEDFMPTQQACKSELWPLFKEAKAASKHAFWSTDELFVDDTQITHLPIFRGTGTKRETYAWYSGICTRMV